jgi:hypothetical protein
MNSELKNLGGKGRSLIDIILTFVLRNLEKPRKQQPMTLPKRQSERECYNLCRGHPVVF